MVDFVGVMTAPDLAGHPNSLFRITLGGKGLLEHLVGHGKIGVQHFPAQLNATIRIKGIGASVLGDRIHQIQISAEQVVE